MLGLNALSCATAKFCVAVNANGDSFVYRGASWSGPIPVFRTEPSLTSVSCAPPHFCVVFTADGFAIPYDGTSWGSPVLVDRNIQAGATIDVVSCASPSFCAVVDSVGDAATFNGSSWTVPAPIGTSQFIAVSCPTDRFCAAVGSGGAVEFVGSSWRTPERLGTRSGAGTPDSVSCASATFCVAGDLRGDIFTFDGAKWSPPDPVDLGGSGIPSVSCPVSSFCVAGRFAGGLLTFDGHDWIRRAPFAGPNQITVASCPSRQFCAVVDNNELSIGRGA